MLQANIFNIQKFSIHDGPGIRTVVFFKGCPLKCKWCANPESQSMDMQILRDKDKCSLCENCVHTCPVSAISRRDDDIYISVQKCTGCAACVNVCPNSALSLSGKLWSIDDVMDVCLQDRSFYEESGGGVTLSGGEVLLQSEFAATLLQRLQEQNIHTAIETSGYAKPEDFLRVLSHTDFLLFDVKHYDPKQHLHGTAVDNSLILNNLKQALELGKPLLVRIPVIPDYNNSLYDTAEFAHLLLSLGVERVQLLPFHQLGQKKHEMLGMDYELAYYKALHEEDLQNYQDEMINAGLDSFF